MRGSMFYVGTTSGKIPVGVWKFLVICCPVLIPAWCLLGMQVLVRCGWEVLDTLGPVRVEILLVSPPSPTVTIRTPTSQVPHTATSKARMRATFNPAYPAPSTSPGLHHRDLLSNPILVLLSPGEGFGGDLLSNLAPTLILGP